MTKRHHLQALACYLAIPVALIAGGLLFSLIDPELARGHDNYERNYRLLELVRSGALLAILGLQFALWGATCFLVLKARQQSLRWLWLAAAGPFGFIVLVGLEDRSPEAGDRYRQFVRSLKWYWRLPWEVALFILASLLAFQAMEFKRDLLIRYESFTTGTPVATIIERQNASSGMYAFGEGLEVIYLVPLIYLLWPLLFNLAASLFRSRPMPSPNDTSPGGE